MNDLFWLIMDISGVSLDGMDAYPPPVLVTDRQGLVIGWTPGVERLLGYTSADLSTFEWLARGELHQFEKRDPRGWLRRWLDRILGVEYEPQYDRFYVYRARARGIKA